MSSPHTPLAIIPVAFGARLIVGDTSQLAPAAGVAVAIYGLTLLACALARPLRRRKVAKRAAQR